MSLISFSTGDYSNPGFVERVKLIVFPDEEPENLGASHNHFIQNGLIIAQKHVPCLRSNNVNFYGQEDLIVNCDTGWFNGPANARIQAVYAFEPGTVCERYHYSQASTAEIFCYAEQWAGCNEQEVCDQNIAGDVYCDRDLESTNFDVAFKCYGQRLFAHTHDDRIYVAPRFPCDWRLAVHWEGIKRHYSNSDLLPDDDDLVDLISLFVRAERSLHFDRDMQMHKELYGLPEKGKMGGRFWQQLAHIHHLCREKVRIRRTANCSEADLNGSAAFDNSSLPGFLASPPSDCTTPTVTLTVNDQDITEGETVTLTYLTSGLPDCDESVVQLLANGVVIQTITRNTTGTVEVTPDEDTNYTLRASSPCNPSVTDPTDPVIVEDTVSVDVDPVVDPGDCVETEVVESVVLGSAISSGTEIDAGFSFSIQNTITVTHLGRWVIAGNSQQHELHIKRFTGISYESLASVTVNTNGAPAGQFLYGELADPIVLAPGDYYIVSEEHASGDQFYSGASSGQTTAQTHDEFAVTGSVAGFTSFFAQAGLMYGPLDMKFCEPESVCGFTEFVTSVSDLGAVQQLGAEASDTFQGCAFTVGSSDLVITHLGRWVIAGNSQVHELVIWNSTDGVIASVTVDTNGATAGGFLYGALPTPIVLAAGRSYALLSEEHPAGDQWYGTLSGLSFSPSLVTTSVASVTVARDDTEPAGGENDCYGPLSMQYCALGNTGQPEAVGSGQLISIVFDVEGSSSKSGAAAVGEAGDQWNVFQPVLNNSEESLSIGLVYTDGSNVMGSVSGQSGLSEYHPGTPGGGAFGMWSGSVNTGHSDVMLAEAMHITSFPAESQLHFNNLPTGTYDVLVYGPGGQLKVRAKVGSGSFTSYKTGIDSDNFDGSFSNNINYIHFGGLVITDSTQNLIIDLAASSDGGTKISGIQLIKRS